MTGAMGGIPEILRTSPPEVGEAEARQIAHEVFGLTGELTRLSSERDVNYCVQARSGRRFLLKISNEKEPEAYTELQIASLRHLENAAPDLPVPRALQTLEGAFHLPHASGGRIRLLSFLEGTLLTGVPRSPILRRSVARAGARLNQALAGLEPVYGGPKLLWDLKNAGELASMTDAIVSPDLRRRVNTRIDDFRCRVLPLLAAMRWQVVHGDLNPNNLLCDPDGQQVVGILDFGDIVRTPTVCDVAVAASYQIDFSDPIATAVEFVAAWHAESPLLDTEIDLLPDLIATRLMTVITVASWRADRYPENAEYIMRNVANATAGFDALCSMAPAEMKRALRVELK